MFFAILLVLFLLVCVFLCLLILIQSDKGGGLSGAIGGLSGANSFLGTQDTANVLTKGTYIFGAVFLVLCVLMTLFEPGGSGALSPVCRRGRRRCRRSLRCPPPRSGWTGSQTTPARRRRARRARTRLRSRALIIIIK